jgi:hypothetical protein
LELSPRQRRAIVRLGLLSLLWFGTSPRPGAAQLGPEGAPITESNYSVDLSQGPVLSATRVTGLGGAFAALAEGLEGGLSNPASVAARTAASADWWDYWVALSVTYPFDTGDFYNSGEFLNKKTEASSDSFLFLNTGAYLQLLELGLGMNIEITQVTTQANDDEERVLRLQLVTNHVQLGYLFLDGQLAVGAGFQILREREVADLPGEMPKKLHANVGFGAEAGILIRPNGAQWRLGAGLFSSVRTKYGTTEQVQQAAEGFVLPEYAVRPWRGSLAFAYQFGERPLNPRFTYVERRGAAELRELDERARRARALHAQKLAELQREVGADAFTRIAAEERDFAEENKLLEAERAAVRKLAWRSLRAGVRRLWPRRYLLLTSEVSFNGKVANGVGLESFMAQSVQRSGEHVSVTPRIAAESEVWPTHVKVRAGTYYEPTRFRTTNGRLHGTFGFDVRLLNWDVFRIWPEDYLWQISVAVDLSRDYQAFSTGIGGWY